MVTPLRRLLALMTQTAPPPTVFTVPPKISEPLSRKIRAPLPEARMTPVLVLLTTALSRTTEAPLPSASMVLEFTNSWRG
jgi:hypothetical protein